KPNGSALLCVDPSSRPFAGAWIETDPRYGRGRDRGGRPFAGAWIETDAIRHRGRSERVAPSRGRGLKPRAAPPQRLALESRPFAGAWIETVMTSGDACMRPGRPFAGAWIETATTAGAGRESFVAPSRGRGLKPDLMTFDDRTSFGRP